MPEKYRFNLCKNLNENLNCFWISIWIEIKITKAIPFMLTFYIKHCVLNSKISFNKAID